MAGKVHWITWEQHEDASGAEKLYRDDEGALHRRPAQRFRARYTQALERVIEQAEHDRDMNGRQDVRIEDADGKVVWPKGG